MPTLEVKEGGKVVYRDAQGKRAPLPSSISNLKKAAKRSLKKKQNTGHKQDQNTGHKQERK